MFEIYDNTDSTYIPNNTEPPITTCPTVIVIGETCNITYNLDLTRNNIKDLVGGDKDIVFIFKNGIEIALKQVGTATPRFPCDTEEEMNNVPIAVSCTLTPEQTKLFNQYLDLYIQVRIILADDSTIYTLKDKAIVKKALGADIEEN